MGLTQDCAHQNCQVVSRGASKNYALECWQFCRIHVVDVQGELYVVGHGIVHQVVRSGSQVVTNVHWWSPDMDGQQVVRNQGKVEHAGS